MRYQRHGLSYHPLYKKWYSMKFRCYNPNCSIYEHYGGRGIVVCEEWKNNPKAYINYVIKLPDAMKPGLTIDRIHNNGNYEPGNLRWANRHTQNTNKNIGSNNTSGFSGIWFGRKTNKWHTSINVDNDRIWLGYYDQISNAVNARNQYIIANSLSEYRLQ